MAETKRPDLHGDPGARAHVGLAALLVAIAACGGPLRDIDGNEYRVARLGHQLWMAESLRTTRSPAGEPLPSQAPNDDPATIRAYGRLYAWATARRACPRGWHLPSDAEWSVLERTLGEHAGGALKDTRSWRSPNVGASDGVGFSARPAGYANDQGLDNQFGRHAVFWSSTPADDHFVWSRGLRFDSSDLRRAPQHPQYGFSVRCLHD